MVITAPKPLRDRLGDDGIDSLIELLNEVEKSSRESSIIFVEEKFEKRLSEEIGKVRVEIAGVKASLMEEIASVKASLREEIAEKIANVKADITKEIAETKAYLIRWMFIFWLGQVASVLGILALTGVFSR